MDSWLAISRICCSRHPLCNKRAFATFVHGPPSSAGLTTRTMCFEASHQPSHQPRDHFHGRKVPQLLLVRLHLPLHVDDRFCKCGARLDVFGHHRSACSRVGLLKPRGTLAEICVARICREKGARVKENQLLSELNTVVPVTDKRRMRSSRTAFLSGLTPQWSRH